MTRFGLKKKRSRKRLARALKRNCSVIFPPGADAAAVGDSPGVPQSLSWQSLRCMGKVCDAREAFAVIIAPAYPRRRALFEILNECTPHPACTPTPKPASGCMPRAYLTRTTKKSRGHCAHGVGVSHGFSEADGLRHIHYATTDFAEHNDISRETTITPAQKTKPASEEWPLRRAESLPRRRQQRYELRVNNPPCK